MDYKLVELLLNLKNASYINNVCNIFCEIYLRHIFFARKIIYSLKKDPNKKSAERKWRNFDFISLVKLQNLISRISVPCHIDRETPVLINFMKIYNL